MPVRVTSITIKLKANRITCKYWRKNIASITTWVWRKRDKVLSVYVVVKGGYQGVA